MSTARAGLPRLLGQWCKIESAVHLKFQTDAGMSTETEDSNNSMGVGLTSFNSELNISKATRQLLYWQAEGDSMLRPVSRYLETACSDMARQPTAISPDSEILFWICIWMSAVQQSRQLHAIDYINPETTVVLNL